VNDPRITLGVDTAGSEGGAVADALDRTRPIVRVDPDLPPAGATAAAALALVLSRLFPHTTLDGDSALGPNPWGASTAFDAVARSNAVVTTPTRAADTDIVIGVGPAAGPPTCTSAATTGTCCSAPSRCPSGLRTAAWASTPGPPSPPPK